MTLRELTTRIFKDVFRPRKKQKVWEWIEEHCELPAESGSKLKGPIDTSVTPYSRAIYEAYGDPKTRFITLVKSAQVGGTTILKCLICYDVAYAPGPQLYVTSTGAQAKRFNDRELEPHFRLCKAVEALTIRVKGIWTKFEKVWRNGATLGIVGSNSVSQLASRTVERLKMDETDKWPAESDKEAAADDLAEARTKTYEDRRKVLAVSTPTIDSGIIWKRFLRGTQEYFEVPCPFCGHYQVLDFFYSEDTGGVWWPPECRREDNTWDLDKVEAETRYACAKCKGKIPEAMKRRMVLGYRPVITNSSAQISNRSFHVCALYSLFETWGGMARAFLSAESVAGKLHDFYNNYLGKPWIRHATTIKKGHLRVIQEESPPYRRGELPIDPRVITMAVDVQQEGFFWAIRAWGKSRESYLVDFGAAISYPDLEEISRRDFKFSGRSFQVYKVMIDSGYTAKRRAGVYDQCLASGGRFFPSKGSSKESGLLHPIRETRVTHRQRDLILVTYDDEIYKEELYCRRIKDRNGPGWYLPQGLGPDYYEQLTAEKLVERKRPSGGIDLIWECPTKNNHYGDCEKLQLVFGDMLARFLTIEPQEDTSTIERDADDMPVIPEWNLESKL